MHIYPSQYPTEHTAGDRTPYTYHIAWSELDVHYYGVRYAKGCHPSDLWNPYKTSSKHVKDFIKENGDPDIIEVRKIFDCFDKARDWEYMVLKRLDAPHNIKWLNECFGKSIPDQAGKVWWNNTLKELKSFECPGEGWRRGRLTEPWNKGITREMPESDEIRNKKSNSHKGKANYRDKDGNSIFCSTNDSRVIKGELVNINKGKKRPKEDCIAISKGLTGLTRSIEEKRNNSWRQLKKLHSRFSRYEEFSEFCIEKYKSGMSPYYIGLEVDCYYTIIVTLLKREGVLN